MLRLGMPCGLTRPRYCARIEHSLIVIVLGSLRALHLSKFSLFAAVTAVLVSSMACSTKDPGAITGPPPSLNFTISNAYGIAASTAAVRDPSPRIRYTVTVSNGSDSQEQIEYGGCWAVVRLFATPDRSGTPVYESAGAASGCLSAASATIVMLEPGQSTDLVGYIDMAAIMRSGIAAGHYYVSVLVSPNGSATPIAAGEVDIQP
jgi:hypothetical protein